MILPAPMLLTEDKRHKLGAPGWIYEIKWDGYRLVAGISDSRDSPISKVRLLTRGGADATKWFPEVAAGLARIPGGPHIMDGEVCVLDDLGRSDFNRLHDRARRRRWYEGADPVVFCVFDLLARDGRSLIALPLERRKAQLADLLALAPPSVMFVGHFDAEHGRQMFEHAGELKLEGLVGKRLGSPYVPGARSLDWVKVKVPGAVLPARFKR